MSNQKNVINAQKRTILLVDDETINIEILKEILGNDYHCLEASNGQEALDALEHATVPVSLILLDINMPVMDGFEFLRNVKANKEFQHIPVIVMTGEKQHELASLHMGAVDFIKKPFEFPEIIIARSKRSIELSEDRSLIQHTQRDELTGVYIYEVFHEYIERVDQYYPDSQDDLIFVDIERFEMIHALYGDNEANSILKLLAKILTDVVRKHNGIIGRWREHSFLLYLSRLEDYEPLLEKINSEMVEENHSTDLSIKMGVYHCLDKSEPISSRINHVEHAREALRGSSKSIAVYDAEFEKRARMEQDLINDLPAAIENRDLKAYFQPKMNIQGEKVVVGGGEALVRWIHPKYGFISPGVFIPLFESNGMISQVDKFVWKEAGKMIRKVKDTLGVELPISVNVSRSEMLDEGVLDTFLEIVKKNDIPASLLHIEITESAYSQDEMKLVQISEEFKAKGFVIEIDDFGSGYSSLNSLTSLHFDIIKLDRKFTMEMEENEKTMKMVEIVAEISKFFDAKLVAEGTETESQVQRLKEIGYHQVQGFFYSKPLPGNEFIEYVKNHL